MSRVARRFAALVWLAMCGLGADQARADQAAQPASDGASRDDTGGTGPVTSAAIAVDEPARVDLAELAGDLDIDDRLVFRLSSEAAAGVISAFDIDQLALGFALGAELLALPQFAVYARFQGLFAADEPLPTPLGPMGEIDSTGAAALFSGVAGGRVWLWEDRFRRVGWGLGAGAGYMIATAERIADIEGARHGPIVEVEALRDILGLPMGLSVGARFHLGLGGADGYRAVVLTLASHPALGFEQRPLVPRRMPAWRSTFGVQIGIIGVAPADQGPLDGADPVAALAVSYGVPLERVFEPRLRVDMMVRGEDPAALMLTGIAGLRARVDGTTPRLFFEVGGGYTRIYGLVGDGVADGPVVDAAIGLRGMPFCGSDSAFELGIRGRVGVGDNRGVSAALLTIGFEHASGWPRARRFCTRWPPMPRG